MNNMFFDSINLLNVDVSSFGAYNAINMNKMLGIGKN